MTVFLYSLCLLSAFGGGAGFVVNRSQHLSVGSAVTLVGGRAGHGGAGWSQLSGRAFPSAQ